jgi:hypothetical protein
MTAGTHFSFTLRLVYIMDTTGRRIVGKRPLFAPFGTLQAALNPNRRGLVRATVSQDVGRIDLIYLGPDDISAG